MSDFEKFAPASVCDAGQRESDFERGGRYFILLDIVDPRTESNPNPEPNPDPNCGFTISHKMKYLRFETAYRGLV